MCDRKKTVEKKKEQKKKRKVMHRRDKTRHINRDAYATCSVIFLNLFYTTHKILIDSLHIQYIVRGMVNIDKFIDLSHY